MVILLSFLVPLLFLAVIALAIVSIAALIRSGRIVELNARLRDLEEAVARLQWRGEARAVEPETPPTEAIAVAELAEVIPVAEHRQRQPRPAAPRTDAATLEDWIGRRGLGWVAVVLLLFATAFFLKYAFENQWIGELGRVALGVVAGAALCVAGLYTHRRGSWLFSQMLSAAGVVLLYLATFAAFGYYHLIPQERAGIFLVVLVLETAALAVLYNAPAIALMAVIGGLLNPILLHADRDQYRSLFTYLAVLDLGVVAVVLFRPWRAVASVALVGTQALFWLWWYVNYHPEKLEAALLFQAAVFVIFLLPQVIEHVVRRRAADVEALSRIVANAFLFAGAIYTLLDEDYHIWLGSAAIGLAVVYTALAWVVLRRRPEDAWQQLVLVATGLAFLAAAFPLQADAAWIALGWAVEGAALACFGLRIRSDVLRGLAAVLFGLALWRLLLVDTLALNRGPFVPIFNRYALPALAVAACLLVAALASRYFLKAPRAIDDVARGVAGLGGVLLVWLILSIDAYQYFTARITPTTADPEHLWRIARTSLSVLWPVYAAILLALGFRMDSRPLRWTALGLFGLTLGKVVLVDMAGLPGFYRVAAFFVLAVVLGGAAWAYQKIARGHRGDKVEVPNHEAA